MKKQLILKTATVEDPSLVLKKEENEGFCLLQVLIFSYLIEQYQLFISKICY